MDISNIFLYLHVKKKIEEFDGLLEADNEYVRQKYAKLNESEESKPIFSSIEEVMEYYDAIPIDEVLNNMDKMFNINDYYKKSK